MPDERRLPPDVAPLAGDIVAEPGAPGEMPGIPSRLSAPFSTVPAPATPPAPLPPGALQPALTAQPGLITTRVASLTIAAPPAAPAGAIGPWRLRVWWQFGVFPIELIGDAPTTGAPFTWSSTAMFINDPVTFWASVVDPLGRESATVQVTVAP